MSVLKDIMDIFKDIDGDTLENYLQNGNHGSLSKMSTHGTLQFPVLITRALDVSTLNMVCAALEKQYVNFTQIAMSMDPTTTKKKGVKGYVRKFHQNTNVKYDKNDFLNDVMTITKESCEFDIVFESVTDRMITGRVSADNKQQMIDIMQHLNLESVNSKFIPNNYRLFSQLVTEARRDPSINIDDVGTFVNTNSDDVRITTTSHRIDETINTKLTGQKDVRNNQHLLPKNMLVDNDIKKSNELVPTIVRMRILLTEDGNTSDAIDFIIGVKAIMHPIKSEEMIENLYRGCAKHGKFFNFIRWTTGEISFVKDLLLNIDEMKSDVADRGAGTSHWWLTLKRRKNIAKLKNNIRLAGTILPNTTIVVSMEEVDYIKTRYGFDLMNEKLVDSLMREYFLLTFVVVDTAAEIVHMLFDGQLSYQSTTFEGMRRDTSNANSQNEMIKLVNKLRM